MQPSRKYTVTPHALANHFIAAGGAKAGAALAALNQVIPGLVGLNSALFAVNDDPAIEQELLALAALTSELYHVRNALQEYFDVVR